MQYKLYDLLFKYIFYIAIFVLCFFVKSQSSSQLEQLAADTQSSCLILDIAQS